MVLVRGAREDEVPRLVKIGLAAWEQAVVGFADVTKMRTTAEYSFGSFLREGWPRILVVEAGGASVGWAARENGDVEISDLWIMPDHQRQGLGSALIDALRSDIEGTGLTEMTARTHAGNEPAIAFFRHHGFHVAWFSTAYLARLDRDVEQIGLSLTLSKGEGAVNL
ncbi:GNAT family N-acetyltransferase [Rhizobium sp. NFR03]|uniref:GNAT family N-acetyltransferase n=1 Tax=Rhizobium sp. NFR03 TaxID=1566263 RepID=UPI0008B36317|nr:GNAT family N-acetyltransferase [Rhizobium sp. NFR03]SES10148.1 ribosomal-protein-alanine N-acetyltransferase [Rhizobium sp. NFR03]